MKHDQVAKPSPAPDYYQVTHLAASAIRRRTQSLVEPRPFECKICGSCWGRNSQLIIHMRIHTGEKPYHCSYCPRSFSHTSNLNMHEMMHRGERPHCCPHCPKAYVQATKLREHLMRSHIGLRLYDCPECPEKFFTADVLKKHRIRNHGGELPYPCGLCDRKSISRGHLNKHLKDIHGILLPYSCSKCDQKFRLQNELLFHEATHEDDEDDPETVKISTTKQAVRSSVSLPTTVPVKSQQNKLKVKSPVPGAKVQENQKKKKSPNKLVKQNKSSKAAAVEKIEIESEEEISVLYEGKKQVGNLVDKSSESKELGRVNLKNKVDSIKASSPTNKIQTGETPADDQKDKSTSKKKFHCSCGNSYKSIDKFQRHKQRNEGHEDAKEITQQPPPSIDVDESPKKKIKSEKFQAKNKNSENFKVSPSASDDYQVPHLNTIALQVRNKSLDVPVLLANKNNTKSPESTAAATEANRKKQVKTNGKLIKKEKSSEALVQIGEMKNEKEGTSILHQVPEKNFNSKENQIEKSSKKRKRIQVKSEPENLSRVEESSSENKRKLLQFSANDDEIETEMCDTSFKKKYHCICGKSYKSCDKFQRHQQRKGHDNDEKVQVNVQQSPSSQSTGSFKLVTKNQEIKEDYQKVVTKSLLAENESGEKSKKKKVRVLPSNNSKVVVKCERKQTKRETIANSVYDTKVEIPDLKMKTEGTSFNEESSKTKISKKIKVEKVAVEYKEKENKVNSSSKCEVQKNKIKTEKVNKDEKSIPNNELKGEKMLKVKKKKQIKTESSPMTSQLSTFSGVEKTKKRRNEDIKVESQEDEVQIVEIKLVKKQDDKNVEEKCSCGKLFSSPEKFQRHRERKGHHIPKTYKCFCSSQIFNNLEEFRSHLWENHR